MVNGYPPPQHRVTTDANANPIRTSDINEDGTIGMGAKAKIVIEDPVRPDVICTVQSTPPRPSGSLARKQRKETEEQRKTEQNEQRSQTSEPKSAKAGKDVQEVHIPSAQQAQPSQQPSIDPKMNLQLAMLDNQLRNILKTGREESQGSSSASDRAKCRDTVVAGDFPQAALSPTGAGQPALCGLPLMNGTLDGAILANIINDDAEVEDGASRDNRDLNLALHTGATNNDEQKLFHPTQLSEEYQAEKEVSVQKPEQLIRIDDDSPRKGGGLVHQISMPETEEEHDEEGDGKKVVLTGVAVEFTPRHNSIMFGGVDERSQTYLPGGEYAQCTSVYVDENATRMAPYTMATQFNVSMASSEEESEGEGDGKWETGRPGSFPFSAVANEKHRQRSIHNLQQMALETDDRSSSSRGDRRHSMPKSVQVKDDENVKPEQTGHIMSRSADAYTMNVNSDSGYITKETHSREQMFKSSSSHSSLKDHQNVLDIPVGNVSPYKSSKLRKDAGDMAAPNKRDRRSSPKKDKFAYAKLKRKDCDTDKASDKSTSDKDGDHLIIDELENEKTHVATTPCVEVTDLKEFEVNSLPEKVSSPIINKYGADGGLRKASMPDTEKFLRDPILEKIKSLSSGTYLPKSLSETSLKSSHLGGSSKSEVPLSDSAPIESKFKSLCDIRTFRRDSYGNYSCGSVRLGTRSQPNLAKVDTKVLDAHLNNTDANDSHSTSTEKATKSKSDLQAREVQSLPIIMHNDQNLEERGAADGESPRQVLSESNASNHTVPATSTSVPPNTASSVDPKTDLGKMFAEKVSLKLTSIKQAERAASIAQEMDTCGGGKDKGKIDWDSSSHSLTDSGRMESGRDLDDCEVQSLNLSKSRSHEQSSRDGHCTRTDMALLCEADEDSLDPSLPQPRPPTAPAPRKSSKVMAAR